MYTTYNFFFLAQSFKKIRLHHAYSRKKTLSKKLTNDKVLVISNHICIELSLNSKKK